MPTPSAPADAMPLAKLEGGNTAGAASRVGVHD